MGLWQILYGIKKTELNDYIEWFESAHIAEKLDRPGYHWAAHYQIDNSSRNKADSLNHQFIALFGSHSTRTFFDPCPIQLKKSQDELTRSMIARRQSPEASILCEEWREDNQSDSERLEPIHAPWILINTFNSISSDQLFNAWCCQSYLKDVSKQPGFIRARKFLGSDSTVKHSIIIECDRPIEITIKESNGDFKDLQFNVKPVIAARRIWPGRLAGS
jgi:hypothetical protein